MNASRRSSARTLWTAVRVLLVLTVLLGVGYTAIVTGLGQLAFPFQANGSRLVDRSGETVGSSLIGQSFRDADGAPLPRYFQPRPSAAGDGYDATSSSGTNFGPEHEELVAQIRARRAEIARFNGVDPAEVPPDALTASASGLDPHISPAYADLQVERVAKARGLSVDAVRHLVAQWTKEPDLGYLGDRVVNVVQLNLALDEQEG
ncbi:potassium-transporting ATPase subunit KdpC [uncultured Tessaracoccus sp.]|uniref:potassium-transporting ATPase subunit KdpC n=1 Tax=uncultured Tessaracoccus sp. TaxID=905023 RepID=UPI0025DE41DA|nr:potassium-transporting ATPase subunit KdpC [uncultured Tessaracoccus sp.]